jgi:hypothetical protein
MRVQPAPNRIPMTACERLSAEASSRTPPLGSAVSCNEPNYSASYLSRSPPTLAVVPQRKFILNMQVWYEDAPVSCAYASARLSLRALNLRIWVWPSGVDRRLIDASNRSKRVILRRKGPEFLQITHALFIKYP